MKLSLFVKPAIWLVLICYGMFLPEQNLPVHSLLKIPYFDKFVHFTLFFIFCLLLFKPFKHAKIRYLFWAPVISIILGAVLESIQRTVESSRSSDMRDFIADATGILASVLFFHYFISGKKWEKFL